MNDGSYKHHSPYPTARSQRKKALHHLTPEQLHSETRIRRAFNATYQELADTFRSESFAAHFPRPDATPGDYLTAAHSYVGAFLVSTATRARSVFADVLVPLANSGAATADRHIAAPHGRTGWRRFVPFGKAAPGASSAAAGAPGVAVSRNSGTVSPLYPGSVPPQVPPRRRLLRVPPPKLNIPPTAERGVFAGAPQVHLDAVAGLPLDLVMLIDDTQREGIRAVLDEAIRRGYDPDMIGMQIANMVGLFPRWQQAVINVGDSLAQKGKSEKEIAYRMGRYSDWLRERRGIMIARCLPPDALIDGAVVGAVTRRWYEGPMVTVITESGREFSATPNHPMLTRRGWVRAGDLRESDDLICDLGDDDSRAPGDEHIADRPRRIDEVFEAAATVGIIERRRAGQPDFHGDGIDGDVDIARSDGELTFGSFSPLTKQLVQESLSLPDEMIGPLFCATCGGLLSIDQQACVCGSAQRDVVFDQDAADHRGRDRKRFGQYLNPFSLLITLYDFLIVKSVAAKHLIRDKRSCLAQRSSRHTSMIENRPDIVSAQPQFRGDSVAAHPASIQIDRLATLKISHYSGHVYNLSTPYGYFRMNGYYTGNTEMMTALNTGRMAGWHQQADMGLLDTALSEKEWLASPGCCEVCAAMDGTRVVGVDSDFDTPYGKVKAPPCHPHDRCTVLLHPVRNPSQYLDDE